jgi:RimJ/RimL family protein N-acetyltransferase
MRDNFSISIQGNKVTLVPYRKKFVDVYHNWMKDPYILEMTASEPLEIWEEYDMQKSWQEDTNKCTFILLSTSALASNSIASEQTDKEISSMVGDVNLFLNDRDDSGNAEIEVMIANPEYRRQGYAQEAIELMMAYGVEHLNLHRFYAKINQINQTSRNLFLRWV